MPFDSAMPRALAGNSQLQFHLCNADLNLLSPEGIRHIFQDGAWLTRGGAIFFLVSVVVQLALFVFAARLDSKRDLALLKIKRIREISSKEYHEDDGNDPLEGLPAYEDFKKHQVSKTSMRMHLKDLKGLKGKMEHQMDVDVADKSWEWLIRIFARRALRYAFKWKMASLEPGAFEYIKQAEFRTEAHTAVTEFVLLPHEQHVVIFLLTASHFTSAFLANYKLSRLERVVSFSLVLLASLAVIVVVFHWLGYFGGDAATADVHPECLNTGRGSAIQFVEEMLVSFAIYFFNNFLLSVAVRIRGGRFLLSKSAAFEEFSWSDLCRRGAYFLFMSCSSLLSLFVVLNFLATATEDDVEHGFLVMAAVLGLALVVKPMVICISLMAFWLASTNWKAGQVTEQMVKMIYIADKKPDTLSQEEIEHLDEAFAKRLLGLQNKGPVFYEAHHEPHVDEEFAQEVRRSVDSADWDDLSGRELRDGKVSMIDRLIAENLQEASKERFNKRKARIEVQSYEVPDLGAEADGPEVAAFDSESWEALNSEDGSIQQDEAFGSGYQGDNT